MVTFDMGSSALSTLGTRTRGASDDLGALVRQLAVAARPLHGRFQGAGRVAFDRFATRADGIAADLDTSLRRILGGVGGMDAAFVAGDGDLADNARAAEGSAGFSAARFSAGR